MPKSSFVDLFTLKPAEKSHSRRHSTSKGKSKSKKMNTNTEDMEYESSNAGKPVTGVDEQQPPQEEDLSLEAQYAQIDPETLEEILKPTGNQSADGHRKVEQDGGGHAADTSANGVPPKAGKASNIPETSSSLKEQNKTQGETNATVVPQQGEIKRTQLPDLPAADVEVVDYQIRMEQLRREYTAKMDSLKGDHEKRLSEKRRQESKTSEGGNNTSDGEITSMEREMYQREIQTLRESQTEMEGQINILLNTQEQINEHTETFRKHIEAQRRAAGESIAREKLLREESELSLRSEIATVQGNYRKEKERAQRYMKTMADMQSADPMKIDNAAISSSVKGLRYAIKNWARAQSLVPSLPPNPGFAGYTKSAFGIRERGPNYDFLRAITPYYQEYTNNAEFKFIIQAYIWRRIVEIIFYDDMWAGIRKSLDDDETEYRLPLGYRSMRMNLEPASNEKTPDEYIAQYHQWRSTSARLIEKRLSNQRRKHTVRVVCDDLLRPIYRACEPGEQEIQNIEDLQSIVEDAMKLAACMASQRASFVFELIPPGAYGNMEFQPAMMSETHPPESFDSRTHYRAVFLLFEPRLVKHGTSEGTAFENTVQLLEGNVETRVVPKAYSKRAGLGR